jgi:FkbM family methyltransferase
MKTAFASLVRALTSPFVFTKRLPRDLGGQRVYVTTRADLRLAAPGLNRAAGDLFCVARKYLKAGDVVWDIGSNLGLFTFAAASKIGPAGQVFSLEADPKYAEIQNRTLRKTPSTAARISVLCAAAADQTGILTLVIPRRGHARNHLSLVEGNSPGTAEFQKQVPAVTLDSLLQFWKAPTFLKMDIEGAEALAAEGGKRLFETVRPTAYIECSPSNSPRMTEFFKNLGYSLYRLDDAGNEQPVDSFRFNTLVKPS